MTFSRLNYLLLAACVLTILIGFMLMSGGAAESPEVFSEEIFSTRRITVAPLVVMAGFALGFFAIILPPKEHKA